MDVTLDVPELAEIANILAVPARARMVEALVEGGSRSAIDLAAIADVQPNTASTHLARLVEVDAGMVVCERQAATASSTLPAAISAT